MSQEHPARMGHSGPSVTRPSAPPIFQTTAFDVPDLDVLQQLYTGTVAGDIYTRDSNPNHSALASAIAQLEGTEAGAVFASGMGAAGSIFLALTSAGDHVILARSLYGKTLQLASRMQQLGIQVSYFDVSQPQQLPALICPRTRFVLVETISNPLLEVADIPEIVRQCGQLPVVVDSTFTTPQLIRPCSHGAAIIYHSASKYLNGHGDVMLGVAAGSRELMRQLQETASIFGQNPNPFESWLTLRGLRTLPLRMQQICETTRRLAEYLSSHPGVRKVHYPLLPTHPSQQLAQQLYPQGTGGIVSIELQGTGFAAVNSFMHRATGIPFSPTLADARTTISHPATTSHRFLTPAERSAVGIADELIRISVGLEPFELLVADFNAALGGNIERPLPLSS
ncbi:MAG: O-succinylhomoserine sulfhydrylase [Planctomycetota bacterium]|jgi:cystathionine beta-lyase/cystathionine gamma-synthase